MSQKQRTIFALKNFRGLDKENKLLKVQPYRATDGYNFIIDSETLKTRPSFTIGHDPNFFLEDGDYLIDWRVFGNTNVYVTKKHIYITSGIVVLNEKSARYNEPTLNVNSVLVRSPFLTDFNHEGLKPLFQEEKDCLFIFCLNEIYVISTIKNTSGLNAFFVLYNLSDKPSNPFADQLSRDQYDKLPTPYVPTLLLGNEAFEDVNLLSKQSKYRLFSNVPQTTNGSTTYSLPTYYNSSKHGTFNASNVKVTFYKGRYEGYEAYPIFMGVHGEDFFGTINSNVAGFGALLNGTAPVVIQNIYFAPKPFEYANTSPESIIFERLYLSKKDFFEFRTTTSGNPTVFEYMMEYIQRNKSTITSNSVLVFTLPVQNEVILKDNSTQNIISQSVRKKNFPIFIQIKKAEEDWSLINKTTSNNVFTTTNLNPLNYPNYPAYVGTPSSTFTLNDENPILLGVTSAADVQAEFIKMAEAKISENIIPLTDNALVGVRGKFYTTLFIPQSRAILFPTSFQQDVLEYTNNLNYYYSDPGSNPPPPSTFPSEPVFLNPNNYSVKDLGILPKTSGLESFTFLEGTPERSQIISAITSFLNSGSLGGFNPDLGFGIFKARMYNQQVYRFPLYDGFEMIYGVENTTNVVVRVSISTSIQTQETRYSFTYTATYEEDAVPIVKIQNNQIIEDNRYEVSLKEDNSIIELKVEDYFYDYKNEPSIEVLVTFQTNTDYNIIAQSKFGTTFGSENRLFLAGNTTFPNIDRYNVSNDLLGNLVTNQSYELSYFPSKNYRVIGGKGAINGYAVATDSQLYITKEEYPNDSKLFIRQRNVSNEGIVNYVEFKTNITKTPLNNRCFVRFYNDILILAKDGLYGLEISQNVLTDERLVKLRSGFINKDLVKAISEYDVNKVFILENNIYMYIFIGEKVYVADSRYITQNPNSAAENVSYEIIEWQVPLIFSGGKVLDDKIYAYRENDSFVYSLTEFNSDEIDKKDDLALTTYSYVNSNSSTDNAYRLFGLTGFPEVFASPQDYVFRFYNMAGREAFILKGIHLNNVSFTYIANISIEQTISVQILNNNFNFVDIEVGSKLYLLNDSTFVEFAVTEIVSSTLFRIRGVMNASSGSVTLIYSKITNNDLYIKHMLTNGGQQRFTLSPLKPESITNITSGTDAEKKAILTIFNNIVYTNLSLQIVGEVVRDVIVYKKIRIPMRWVSAITDFGNSQMEKTSFRVNLYATKKEETNDIAFGYRTMRRMAGFSSAVDLSNNFDFEEVDYSQFTMATFNTTALSFPMKENNFLYIQFTLNGVGKIEMNGVEVIYKLNRMLKSVG